jgi:hypothetical protein
MSALTQKQLDDPAAVSSNWNVDRCAADLRLPIDTRVRRDSHVQRGIDKKWGSPQEDFYDSDLSVGILSLGGRHGLDGSLG